MAIQELGPLPSRDPKRDEVLKAKINEIIALINTHDDELTTITAQLMPGTPDPDPLPPPPEQPPVIIVTNPPVGTQPPAPAPGAAPPHLVLSPSSTTLTFNCNEGGSAPADQVFTVTNSGGGSFAGPAVGSVTGTGLSAVYNAGTLTVSINNSTMVNASTPYSGSFSLTDANADNSPINFTTTTNVGVAGTTPNPTALAASNRQFPDYAAYEVLGVRALSRGSTYADPTSNRKVLKLTSATSPSSNSSAGVDYSSGGGQISHLHTTNRVTAYYWSSVGNSHVLTDVDILSATPSVIAGSDRNPPATLAASRDQQFSFSCNAATPHVAYYIKSGGSSGGRTRIAKLDTTVGVMSDLSVLHDFAPTATGDLEYLQNDLNDRWFVTQQRDHARTFAWDSQTDTQLSVTPTRLGTDLGGSWSIDEPHLDHAGGYCYISGIKAGVNHLVRWDLSTDVITDTGIVFSHQTGARGRAIYHNGSNVLSKYTPSTNTGATVGTNDTCYDGDAHKSTQWIQANADVENDYALLSPYGDGGRGYQNGAALGNGTTALAFTLSSGAIYYCTPTTSFDDNSVDRVIQTVSGSSVTYRGQLTSRGSLGAITGAGEYYYDSVANRLYIRAFEDLDLTVAANASKLAAFDPSILHDGLHLVTVNGTDKRFVSHHYTSSVTYNAEAHATISRGGHAAMWNSDQNSKSGRVDAFLVQLPVS